tara:strand:+ start:18078 stop:18842 length:765 start_codon:yes stop_codon:yes gene_type:complete
MEVNKHNKTFKVFGNFSQLWFTKNRFDKWENNTFHILDEYANKNLSYIDIGAWIGPTVLYASPLYKNIICLEPDKIALRRLYNNIKVNNFKNIRVIEKCLSNNNNPIQFGGNGTWGNSESTILVSNKNYGKWGGRWDEFDRTQYTKMTDSITIEKLFSLENLDPTNVSLIKMDIEGGELIVIPAIKNFLEKHKIPIYISIHYCFLKDNHISKILDILFNIYSICYVYDSFGNKHIYKKNDIICEKQDSLLFTCN